jgi:hypothetical protein
LRIAALAVFLFAAPAALPAQAPAQTPAPAPTPGPVQAPAPALTPARTDPASEVGIGYAPPAGWDVVERKPPTAAAKAEAQAAAVADALADEPIKGTACIRVPLTARQGTPSSVIVEVVLPFDCYGQTMTAQELEDFGSGVMAGLKQTFDLLEPVYAVYLLGSHSLWIERARGNPKGHAETQYTLEIACSLLARGAACWMALAADEASLQIFENNQVTLEGDPPAPLVPAAVFSKPPSP